MDIVISQVYIQFLNTRMVVVDDFVLIQFSFSSFLILVHLFLTTFEFI